MISLSTGALKPLRWGLFQKWVGLPVPCNSEGTMMVVANVGVPGVLKTKSLHGES